MRHSAEQFRLYSGRSTNTEKEEATFNTLKTFTNLTSNHHTENIIFNAIVRMQAKEKLEGEKVISSQSKAFQVMYNPIKEKLQNSLISFDWIEKHPGIIKHYLNNWQTIYLRTQTLNGGLKLRKASSSLTTLKKMMDLTVKLRCIISDHRVLKLYLTMFMNAG